MTTSVISGFDICPAITTPLDGGPSSAGVITRDTTVFRSGLSSAKGSSGAGNTAASTGISSLVGTSEKTFWRVYLRFGALPASTVQVMQTSNGTTGGLSARLTPQGKVQLWDNDGSQIGSDSEATIQTDTWYRFELLHPEASGSQLVELRLDGATVASATGTYVNVGSGICECGWVDAPGANKDVWIDDFVINDNTGSVNNSWPGDGKVAMLLPISDNARTAWTDANGGTTGLYDAVDNTPPAGVASANESANPKASIKDPASSAGTYTANLTTYTDAGIASGDTITALRAIVRHGEDIATGSKTGTVGALTNPTVAGAAITFGDDAGAHGIEPGTWKFSLGTITENPTVTLGTSPTISVVRGSESRVACVDFMGIYVAWTPSAGTPKSGSDSGAGAEASTAPAVALASTEAGTGGDAFASSANATDIATDAGTGAETASVDQGTVAKSASDAAVGTEAVVEIGLASTEAGAAADTAALAAASDTRAEAGAGTDAPAALAAAIAGTAEAGTGADGNAATSVPIVGTESGIGSETAAAPAAAHALSEAGAAAESGSLAAATDTATDAGTGADGNAQVAQGVTFVNATDAGTGTEAATIAALYAAAESAVGAELAVLTAGYVVTDSGVAAETTGAVGIVVSDAATATDLAALAALLVAAEAGLASEAAALSGDVVVVGGTPPRLSAQTAAPATGVARPLDPR